MGALAVDDRDAIASVLRRAPARRAYELGDLDDAEWPWTRWFGRSRGGRLDEVILLYLRPEVPVLVAVDGSGDTTMRALLEEIVDELPRRLYVHVSEHLLDVLRPEYDVESEVPHLKLALCRPELVHEHAVPVEVLDRRHLDELRVLYEDAYPGTWFEPRQLETARYVGIRRDGRLVCVAGVHVFSPTWGVAALGNVATSRDLRGRGLAGGACASLCRLLLEDGIATIALNVRSDNAPAIRAYERIGFEPVAEYVEADLVARSSEG